MGYQFEIRKSGPARCLLAGAALFMLALFNHSLIHFHSFGEMWVQYVQELYRVSCNHSAIEPIWHKQNSQGHE